MSLNLIHRPHPFDLMKGSARIFLTILAMFSSLVVIAQSESARRLRNFNTENGVALRKFDPVSYFNSSRPLIGSSKFDSHYKGITYYFANAANMEEFEKSPEKYEPAYGGWCAYTVAVNGDRVKINPVTYKIIDGKLHLFYNFGGDNRLRKWNVNEEKFEASARKNWIARMH